MQVDKLAERTHLLNVVQKHLKYWNRDDHGGKPVISSTWTESPDDIVLDYTDIQILISFLNVLKLDLEIEIKESIIHE